MVEFRRARAHTVDYHRRLYASTALGSEGWLARPSRLVLGAIDRVEGPVHAYDLGAGVGRHAIPMAQRLPEGSSVTAVDLLPSALHRLRENARAAGVAHLVETVTADLERFELETADAGLTVCVSSLEHLPDVATFRDVLGRVREATRPAGIVALGVLADRREVTTTGSRPALIELPLTVDQTRTLIDDVYAGWKVLRRKLTRLSAPEQRGDEVFTLTATQVGVVLRRPG